MASSKRRKSVMRKHTAKEFIQQYKTHELLKAINDAYDDSSDSKEQVIRQKMRNKHKELVKGQWY
jgi:hypothetical protein